MCVHMFDSVKWYKGCVVLAVSTSNGLGARIPGAPRICL